MTDTITLEKLPYEEQKEFLHEESIIDGMYKDFGTNKDIILYTPSYDGDNDLELKIIEKICKEYKITWEYSDQYLTDKNMGITYYTEDHNYIFVECEILGKAGFDDGSYDFISISNSYIDKNDMALPTWFSDTDLSKNGFEKMSCEFDYGMYEHNKNNEPSEIIEQLKSKYPDCSVIFKIDYSTPFDIGFCVYIKK